METKPTQQDEIPALTVISRAAFDTDTTVGNTDTGEPPDHDTVPCHEQMRRGDHMISPADHCEAVGDLPVLRDQRDASLQETINALNAIFDRHRQDRICILGTTCCGKSTLHERLPGTEDMDERLWPTLTAEEEARFCQKPWTEEIGAFARKLVTERVTVRAGRPLFSLILLDCDAIVYLDIDDGLLAEHCKKRGSSFQDAKNVKKAIESTWERQRKSGEKTCYYLKMPC